MNADHQVAAMEQRAKNNCDKSFHAFMENPATKVLLSIAPPFEHMEQLLKAAYESGFRVGQSNVALEMIDSMFKDMRR